MNLNDLFNEEKVRLDPKCWTGKKIGNPKTKMKGGVRVNNCVPAESVAEANDPNFVGFMNNTLGDRVDAKPEQPKTGHDWYDNAPTMSMDNMPSYKHAFKFGMSVLQSMDAETKQHFAEADNDELFSYLMKLARKKGFEPKYFVEEDMFEVTGLFSEIFHDPEMQDWEWADLLRSTLNNQGIAEGMKAHELSQYCEELVAEKGWDAAYKHASMMANIGRDPAWNGVLKYLDAMKQGVAEGIEGSVVFSGTGDNGGKYEIIQSGPNDFMIHANGKHIDSYDSLQRAMSVLQNEVPGLTKGVAEAKDKFSTPQQQAELRSQMDGGGEDPDARDRYGNLKRSTSPGLGGTIDIGGVNVPVDALASGLGSVAAIGSLGGTKGMFGKPRDSGTTSRDIATQRDTGQGIPSLGQSGKVVTSKTADNALVKLGGKNVETTPGPTVKSGSTNVQLDPVVDVPTYVRQGKPDLVTIPKPGTKPKIIMRPGETMNQAVQRTKDEQEFGKFLQGQGGQKFGNPNAAQATSGPGQVPTIRLPDGSLIVDPSRLSPSGQYGRFDKIARDDEAAVNAMVKKARENAEARAAAQAAKEKQLGLEPGSLRPRSQYEKERDSALRDEEKKLGLPPGSLHPKPTEKTSTSSGEKENSGIFNYIKDNPKKSTVAAIGTVSAADEYLKDKKLKEQSPKKQPPEVDYDDEYQAMVARVRKLAGIGPMKTVWDPARRVYKNVPTADQPQKK